MAEKRKAPPPRKLEQQSLPILEDLGKTVITKENLVSKSPRRGSNLYNVTNINERVRLIFKNPPIPFFPKLPHYTRARTAHPQRTFALPLKSHPIRASENQLSISSGRQIFKSKALKSSSQPLSRQVAFKKQVVTLLDSPP